MENVTDLVLTPESRPGRYTLICGDTNYPIDFRPETDVVLGDLIRRLQSVLVGGEDPSGQLEPSTLIREVGMRLWQALASDAAPADQRDALVRELRRDTFPLQLALPANLAALPWELLCNPQQVGDSGFLALRRPLVRLVSGGANLAPLAPPLRVLLLISSPPGIEERRRVDVESERAAVENATRSFREAGLLHLQIEDIVTPRRVQQALLRFKPHVLHYIGHGGYAEGVGGFLEWEDDQGKPLLHPDARIADLVRPRGLRAVILHGCETATSDRRTDFNGVAGALVGAGIPAVLAQQAKFTYESSQRASEMFYTALTAGLSMAEASFELRIALAQADRPDWAVPILQATSSSVFPVLDETAAPGPADLALARNGAASDLPAPTGVFVGRQSELRALRLMMESAPGSGPVLAFIAGPGGVGKSTLTAQAIVRYGARYRAALTLSCLGFQSFDLFLQHIGEFLQGQDAPALLTTVLPDAQLSRTAKIQTAVQELDRAGPFLAIIDNLESVQAEDRTLADPELLLFLQTCLTNLRNGRVLVTGRYAVESLVPYGKFAANLLTLDLDDLSGVEIRQLLARHSSLAQLSEVVIDELVREFGGLPYVYDLLSSQANSQSLAALIHDIQGRMTQERQQRSAAEWQQIRRRVVEFAALDATVSLLPEASRTLLGQLTVFQRPFPLDALEQGLGVTQAEWQPLLDRSLLRYDLLQGDYRLHSLTAHYAARLLDGMALEHIQTRVAEWYRKYVDTSHDLADILEAHRLFVAARAVQRAGELVNGLADTLSRFGLYQLWRGLCETTLHTVEGQLAAEAQRQLGMIAQAQGQYDEARRLYGEVLTTFDRLGDQGGRASTLHQLGMIAQDQGQYDEARRLYGESMTINNRLGNQGGRASTLHQLGMIAQDQGQYDEARRLYGESMTINNRLGNQGGRASTLHQLGNIAQDQGQYDEARRLYGESMTINNRLGNQGGRASTLHQLGNIAQDQGQYDEAWRLYGESLMISDRLGDQDGRASTLGQLGNIAYAQGQYDEARRLYGESMTINNRLGNQGGRASTLHQLGMIAQDQGQYDEAWRLYGESLTIEDRLGHQGGCAITLHQLGMIAQVQGQYDEARRLYGESMTIKDRLEDQNGRAITLHQLGNIAQVQGQYDEARRLYGESLTTFDRLGNQGGRASTLHQLGMIAQDQGQYDEARRLYGESLTTFDRLGNQGGRASTLHQLGMIAQDQGQYDEARRLYGESMTIKDRLGNQDGRASTLHQLGMIAQDQGQYDEARRLYGESMTIEDELGNQGGRASTLHQLGLMARQEGDNVSALHYMAQALKIFEYLSSPHHNLTLYTLTDLRSEMDEQVFIQAWRQAGMTATPPSLSQPDSGQDFLQRLIAFIQAHTWNESQQLVETQPDLLTVEADNLLIRLAAAQQDEEAHATVDRHRALLVRCREIGIAEAFAEIQPDQQQPLNESFAEQLNHLCNHVIAMLREGSPEQREELATRIETDATGELLIEGAADFLYFLIRWLRGEVIEEIATKLNPDFHSVYENMVIAVSREAHSEDEEGDSNDGMKRLLQDIYTLMIQGTTLQRQHFAEQLDTLQQQLPLEQAELNIFLSCLSGLLRGQSVDAFTLEEPFAEIWQDLQMALTQVNGTEGQER